MQDRLEIIQHWLSAELQLKFERLEPASSDASFRRYFRITTADGTRIVMDAPPEHEDIRPFARIARILHAGSVHVPHIYASCVERGLMLLEDLGTTPYLACLNASSADKLYGAALDTLLNIQRCAADELPAYDAALLMEEMRLFEEWFLEIHLGLHPNHHQRAILDELYGNLVDNALKQSQVFVHRDYHSRNLMLTEDHFPGVIDFQDAVRGPVTYDLMSLVRDSYIEWPEEHVTRWIKSFYRQLTDLDAIDIPINRFIKEANLMSAQRHLKVAGIFARLHHRDGKSTYLKHIPLTLSNLKRCLFKFEEFKPFVSWLEHDIIPRLKTT